MASATTGAPAVRTGAQAMLDGLRSAGITHLVTLPGTQTLSLLRLIAEQGGVEPVFVRSEQAAAYAAVGYARATGRPAACLSVPGPGATNMISGVAAAHADAVPLVVITPQLDDHMLGRQAVHDSDLPALFAPVVKDQYLAGSAADLGTFLVRAAVTSREAPMGPVHVQYPQALAGAEAIGEVPDPPTGDDVEPPAMPELAAIVEALRHARRPMLQVGSEVSFRDAGRLVVALAERFDAPVMTDEDARGVISEDHRLAVGCASHSSAVRTAEECDFCLAVGTRFSEWSTKSWTLRLPAALAHVTESGAALGQNYPAAVAVNAPVDAVLAELVARTRGMDVRRPRWWPDNVPQPGPAVATTAAAESAGAPMHPAAVVDALSSVVTAETLVALDGSSSAMWMSERFRVRRERAFLQSEVFREIGSALLMGIGAAVAQADPVLVVQGDGGMLFQVGELSAVAQRGLRLIVVIFEDGYYNADRLFQENVYGGRLSDSAVHNPDYVALAESFGLRGVRAATPEAIGDAVRDAYAAPVTTLIVVPTLATAAPARMRERFVEWRRRLDTAQRGS